MCPMPPPSTAGANASCTSRNVPLPPDNDQAGPSTAIPNPPAVEDHVSDDAYSEVQDSEVNDHVLGRRKRRQARSELIRALKFKHVIKFFKHVIKIFIAFVLISIW